MSIFRKKSKEKGKDKGKVSSKFQWRTIDKSGWTWEERKCTHSRCGGMILFCHVAFLPVQRGVRKHVTDRRGVVGKKKLGGRRTFFTVRVCFHFSFLQISSDGHEETFSAPIAFEISSNASKFAVFSAIRSLVLEHETKYYTLSKFESKLRSIEHQARSKSDDDSNDVKIIDALNKLDGNKINVPFVSENLNF
jgi:hypothetical protein